jgi:integrase
MHVGIGSASGHGAANQALKLLRQLFAKSEEMEWCESNPARSVKKFPERSRDRFITQQEMPAFFQAVYGLRSTVARDFFLLALFTGGRRSNVTSMRWDEIDFDARVWRIPPEKAKRREPILTILVPEAITILESRHDNGSEWVLPGNGKDNHYSSPHDAWEQVLKKSGLKGIVIHDLRRTLGSWQAQMGTSLPVIGKTLSHSSPSSTVVYARLQLDAARDRYVMPLIEPIGVRTRETFFPFKSARALIA